MPLLRYLLKVRDKVLHRPLVLCCLLSLVVRIECGIVVFTLPQGSHLVGIAACLIIHIRAAYNDSVDVPLGFIRTQSRQL